MMLRELAARHAVKAIGADACLLLVFIAAHGDWNESEMAAALGKTLDELRPVVDRARTAGWLRVVYIASTGTRKYTVTVPTETSNLLEKI